MIKKVIRLTKDEKTPGGLFGWDDTRSHKNFAGVVAAESETAVNYKLEKSKVKRTWLQGRNKE